MNKMNEISFEEYGTNGSWLIREVKRNAKDFNILYFDRQWERYKVR